MDFLANYYKTLNILEWK